MNTKLKKNNKNNKNKKQELKIKELICENECFICLEIYYNTEIPIKLNESPNYPKKCECNIWVHNFCLDKWYSTSFYICPICKEDIFTDVNQNQNQNQNTDINLNQNTDINLNQNIIIINNNAQISHFIIIISKMNKKFILLLSIFSILYIYFNNYSKKKETGFAY